MLKKHSRLILEPLLLFMVFFLPSYLGGGRDLPPLGSDATFAMLSSIVAGIPQLLLMLYLVSLQTETPSETWGLIPLRRQDILFIAFVSVSSVALTIPLVALASNLPPGYRWSLQEPIQIPLAICFGLATGYREEFFFRSYLFARATQAGFPGWISILLSSALFGLGHAYEGILGIAAATVLGVLYSIVYFRRPSLHVVAISHGLYNSAALCFSLMASHGLPSAYTIGIL